MWLGKILDLNQDVSQEIKDLLSKSLEPKKLTPLEFTILENIFNLKTSSGHDLIESLNKHFAGTVRAKPITILPMLSKLKLRGFLDSKTVKSPLGPLVKVYYLTEAGEEVLKTKVNKNFLDQLRFIENLLKELASIYIKSFPEAERNKRVQEVQNLIVSMLESVKSNVPVTSVLESKCSKCNAMIDRENSKYCPNCGEQLS
ncbi:MAG: helix-turn-helix transcriptional regulator [Candidatus Helarchaeota archaeon]|nr:helix-turn-helix transcriptional regulator [Candidatus Helarchaeota archaeon]